MLLLHFGIWIASGQKSAKPPKIRKLQPAMWTSSWIAFPQRRFPPKSGSPLYYEGGFTGYYFVAFMAYIAFYRVQEDRILVDRVVYGKSDYIRTLFRRLNP